MRHLLVLLALAAGCAPAPPPPVPDAPRFLALGDSYTIGEGVPEAERWPVQLAEALRADGVEVADPEIVATTSWTTDELDAGIDAADPQGPFALVTLLIGVNDQYRGLALDGFRERYRALLDRAVGFADAQPGRVVAVSFPDWGRTPFAADRDTAQIAADVDAFNAAARAIAAERGIAWVDVTGRSRGQGALVVADRLHPNGAAYSGWVEDIAPAARAALER